MGVNIDDTTDNIPPFFLGENIIHYRLRDMPSYVLYSTGAGVKRVHAVLSGLRMRLFVCVNVCISCRYYLIFAFAMVMSLCVDVMVMSSAYVLSFTGACGVRVSDVYTFENGVWDVRLV